MGCSDEEDICSPLEHMSSKHREATHIIDEEIAKLEETIRQLKLQRNNLAPSSQLPPEIFGRIFAFVVAAARKVSYTRPASWFAFSHVSHLWRAIALETPDIWATPPLQYSQWTDVMLERCKTADLIIRVDFSRWCDITEPLKNTLENHLSHIREIQVARMHTSAAAIVFNSLPTYAPRLYKLRIHSISLLTNCYIDLPESLFAEARQLRHVDLSGCNFNWGLRLFCGLIHLKISNAYAQPTMTEFFVALQCMPELETLDLQDALPLFIQPQSNPSGQSVDLPRLRSLRLSSPMGEVLQAVGLLTIPHTTTVEIESREIVDDSQLDGLVSWISTSSKGADTPYLSLSVLSNGDELDVKAWKKVTEGPYVNTHYDHLGVPNFSLKLKPQSGKMETALMGIFVSLKPHSIIALDMCGLDISDSVLAKSFGSIPLLKRVKVEGDRGAHQFIKALAYTPKDGQTSQLPSECRVAFPALRCLSLEHVIFDVDYPLADSIQTETLHEILIHRYEENAALDQLGIFKCYCFGGLALKLMEEIVVNVDWDGVERDCEEEDHVAEFLSSLAYANDDSEIFE